MGVEGVLELKVYEMLDSPEAGGLDSNIRSQMPLPIQLKIFNTETST